MSNNPYYDQDTEFVTGFAGCVDKETEYLTPTGWKKISEFTQGELIAVATVKRFENTIKFERPLAYMINKTPAKAYEITNTGRSLINMVLTPEHNVLYKSAKNTVRRSTIEMLIKQLANVTPSRGTRRSPAKIQCGFKLSEDDGGIELSDDEIRLLLAIQADGHLKAPAYVRFNLKKARKKQRLEALLKALGIDYDRKDLPNGFSTFVFINQYTHLHSKSLAILWGVNMRQAKVVVDEAPHWDGSFDARTGEPMYFSTNKSNVDVLQYCFTLVKQTRVSVNVDDRVGKVKSTGYIAKSVCYTTAVTQRKNATFTDANIKEVIIDENYCFTTSTGGWVARRHGFIFITGNSGKSTELVKRATPTTLVLVPTHKAADVLIGKGLTNVYTIHSVLKLVPTINENFRKKMATKLMKVGNTDLSKVTDVFIDEFSMINEEILNTLMDALPNHCKVTIFGDPYQLPPVTGTPIEPWEPVTELTKQHRSKNPEGTKLFMEFMEAIRDNKPTPEFNPKITKDWVKLFNPETDRILAFTNKRMIELNNMVATSEEFEPGDEVVINGLPATIAISDNSPTIYPNCIAKGKLLEETKLIKQVYKTRQDIAKYSIPLGMYRKLTVEIDGNTYNIHYDPKHYETATRLKADVEKYQKKVIVENRLDDDIHIPTWCRNNKNAPGVLERGRAWSKYLAHTNYVFNVTHPYCTTVHKAQGSEFSTVFIDVDDMDTCYSISPRQYNRLMYVALSRAIDKIIFI